MTDYTQLSKIKCNTHKNNKSTDAAIKL